VNPATATAEPTPTAPARPPAGFWLEHPRYRRYVLFGGTGLVLAIDALIVLRGVRALGEGIAAWEAYLAALGSPIGIAICWLLFLTTLFFSIRWLRVGAKIPPVPIPFLFSLPPAVFLVGHYATLAVLSALLLLILAGVIL
jgi:fumarate reductase subunit C